MNRSLAPFSLLERPSRQAALRWLMDEAPAGMRPAPTDEARLCAEAALGGHRSPSEILRAAEPARRRHVLTFLLQHHLLEGMSVSDGIEALAPHAELPGIRIGSTPELMPSDEMEPLAWRDELALGAPWARTVARPLAELCTEALQDSARQGYDLEKDLCALLDRAANATQWDQILRLEADLAAPLRLPLDAWLSFAQRQFSDYWAVLAFVPDASDRLIAELSKRPSAISLGWLSPLLAELMHRGDDGPVIALVEGLGNEDKNERSEQDRYGALAQACAAAGAAAPILTLKGKAVHDETLTLLDVYLAVARRDENELKAAAARSEAHPSWATSGHVRLGDRHTEHAQLAVHSKLLGVLDAAPPEVPLCGDEDFTSDRRWHPAAHAALDFEAGERDATKLAKIDFHGLCDTLPIVFRRGPAGEAYRREPVRWMLTQALLHDLVSAHYAMPGAEPLVVAALDALYRSEAIEPIVDACRALASEHARASVSQPFLNAGRHSDGLDVLLASPEPKESGRALLWSILHQLPDERSPLGET